MDRTGNGLEPTKPEGEQLEEVRELPSSTVTPVESLRSTVDISNVASSLSSASVSLPPRPSSIHTLRNESAIKSSPLSTAFSELEKGSPVTKRERTVSWGNAHEERTFPATESKVHGFGAEDPILLSDSNVKTVIELSPRNSLTNTNSSIFSAPFMNEEADAWNSDAATNNSRSNLSFLSNTSRNTLSSKIQPLLDLNAVLRTSPLETEAETRILRAIEARDLAAKHQAARQHGRNPSSIFGNVSPESVSVFTEPSNTRSDEDIASGETLLEKSKRQGFEKSFLVNRTSKQPLLSQESKDILEIPRGNLRRGATEGVSAEISSSSVEIPSGKLMRGATVGFVTANEKNNSSLEYSVTLDPIPPRLQRGVTGGLVEKRKTHRRTDTLEQRLAGLSDAIAVIKGTDDEILLPSGRRVNDQQSKETIIGGGVADTLVQNATLILRPNRKPTSPQAEPIRNETSSQHEGATNHWNKIKTAVKTGISDDPKKTDEDLFGADPYLDSEYAAPESDRFGKPALSTMTPGPEKQSLSSRCTKQSYRYLRMPSALKDFRIFLSQKRNRISVIAHLMLMVIVPSALISMILFYFAGNPPTGRLEPELTENKNGTMTNHMGRPINPYEASASWWILYIGVRHVTTLSLSLFMQTLVIDFLCLSSRIMVGIFGNLLTLLIVQSKGWPFTFFVWALFNFGLLRGSSTFVQHWLYWQELLGVFNKENPSGNVTENEWNRALLIIVLVITVLVAIKRLWLGLFLGRKTYANYAGDLANVINKILCLCEVAALARDLQRERDNNTNRSLAVLPTKLGMSKENFDKFVMQTTDQFDSDGINTHDNLSVGRTSQENSCSGLVIDPNDVDQQTGGLSQSQKTKLIELLGEWEVPEQGMEVEENPSISAILQFRHSLSLIDNRFMFSIAWGDVSGRERMVVNSQNVFCRMLQPQSQTDLLSFDVLAQAARGDDGSLDRQKLKLLIRLFRPERDGTLSLLQFLKSVDSIYKEAKLLRASVFSSEKIDRAFERAVNIIFYTVVSCITLSQLGFDPLAMFISLSSIILAFAFMIGTASSKMFEGFIFILIRRPYDIGDRIHVSNIEADTSTDGSLGWIVKDVDLFTTTVVFGSTNERATLSNGSMASSRIINMARSQNAILMIYNKFPTEVSFEKVRIFEDALRQFVKSRPREWANFIGFLATKVMSDLGYIEYILLLQHRDSWQSVVNILSSKAEVSSFCLELTNKLDMRYVSPPLPVDLSYRGSRPIVPDVVSNVGQQVTIDQRAAEELVALFEPA